MTKSRAQIKANSRYRSKSVRQVNVPFYPADQSTYDHLQCQANKAGYIKELIKRDIEPRLEETTEIMPVLESNKQDDFQRYCEEVNCLPTKPAWPDVFGLQIRGYCNSDDRQKGREPIRVLSLFSGAGGLDIGFTDAGFEIVEAVEIEDKFCKTLEKNASEGPYKSNVKVQCTDIRKYSTSNLGKIDFIIGGPPCQTFSAAGRRANGVLGTDDARGMLFTEYVRVLGELKPKGFLFENVYGITGAQGGKPWANIKAAFSKAGYDLFFRLLDAADYGAPQHRERLIIVGIAKGTYRFPKPIFGPDSSCRRPFYNAGLAIKDAPSKEGDIPDPIAGKYGYLIPEIPPGLNYSFFTQELGHPAPLFAWRSKFSDFMYKADPSVPTRTIKAQGGQYTGPFHWDNRHFSVAEYKRLQTFPDNYVITGRRAVAIQQIGNSVPPQLARVLALSIRRQVFDRMIPFHMDTLNAEEKLGFRKRKRQLTAEYHSKAKEALAETNVRVKKLQGEKLTNVYLDPVSFEVAFTESSHGENIHPIRIKAKEKLELQLSPNRKKAKMIALEILPVTKWTLPYKAIKLEWPQSQEEDITVAWKALELLLSECALKADLVQLSGYYQYKSVIKCELEPTKSKWYQTLANVTSGKATRKLVNAADFAAMLGVKESDVMQTAMKLRTLGYEVRNWNTNSQVPKNHWLLPYEFPTFSPMSIQRNKQLKGKRDE